MASTAKKLRKTIKRAEIALGQPIVRRPVRGVPDLTSTPTNSEPVELFVVVFGRRFAQPTIEVLGLGVLPHAQLVLPDEDVIDLLNDGATATSVGVAWVQSGTPHTEQLPVEQAGMRVGADDEPDPDIWAIALAEPSTAPIGSTIPPGASPASAWCYLFRWVSWCQTN